MFRELHRAFMEGGEGMWLLLFAMLASGAAVVLGGIVLAVLRPKPIWRGAIAAFFFAVALAVVGVGIGFHALGEARMERAIASAGIDPESRERIREQGEHELSWLYLFAPIAAAPALLGSGAAGAYALAGMARSS